MKCLHRTLRPIALSLVFLLAGCTLPKLPALPFLNQVDLYTCESLPVGILIGNESDPYFQEQRDGYELALQEINNAGGVNGCPMELIYQEETMAGNPDYTQTAVRSLVEDSQVLAVVGGTSDTATMYAASLINYFEIPMVIPSAGGTHITPTENLWAFRLSASEEAIAETTFQMIKDMLGSRRTIAIIFDDTTFGHDAAAAAVTAIEARNLDVAAYIPYNSSDEGFDTIVADLQIAMPEVLYVILRQPQQAENLLASLQEGSVQPGIVIARGAGFASYSFLAGEEGEYNEQANHLVIASHWDVDVEDAVMQEFLQKFADYTRKKYGEARIPTQFNVEAYSSLVLLSGALGETMESADVDMNDIVSARLGLRQALQSYKTNLTPLGTIELDAAGQNQSLVYLFQILDGELVIVYPPDVAAHSPVFDFDY